MGHFQGLLGFNTNKSKTAKMTFNARKHNLEYPPTLAVKWNEMWWPFWLAVCQDFDKSVISAGPCAFVILYWCSHKMKIGNLMYFELQQSANMKNKSRVKILNTVRNWLFFSCYMTMTNNHLKHCKPNYFLKCLMWPNIDGLWFYTMWMQILSCLFDWKCGILVTLNLQLWAICSSNLFFFCAQMSQFWYYKQFFSSMNSSTK